MDIDEFISDTYVEQNDCKSFRPIFINKEWTWQDTEINVLLEKASIELGGSNSLADFIHTLYGCIYDHLIETRSLG